MIAFQVGGASNAGRHDRKRFSTAAADHCDLLRGCHDPIEAGGLRKRGKPGDLLGRIGSNAHLEQRLVVQASQHRHRDKERPGAGSPRRLFVGSLAGRAHHGGASRGVNVDHPGAEARAGGDSAGNCVRNVVKLQVEKNPVTASG